ncbi:uncharacterized protein LOC122811115 [Protopterus annectens]|uniref:uncharacterized protein LOC122811115 n=1 Tax=Protopterus annectens TaxID=7888 RepID=UPI001CFBE98A|nr:uncharacterized protein LOC122811115 [Protopterus annectens]
MTSEMVPDLTSDSLWTIKSARSIVVGFWTYHMWTTLYRRVCSVIEGLSKFWTALQVFKSAKYATAKEQTHFCGVVEAKHSKLFFFLYPFYKNEKTNTSENSVTNETYLSFLRDCVFEYLFRPFLKKLKFMNSFIAIQSRSKYAFIKCSADFSSSGFIDSCTVASSRLSQSDCLVSQIQTDPRELPENSVWNGVGGELSDEVLTCLNTFDDESDSIISDDSVEGLSEWNTEEDEELWNSFLKCSDPYRLFNFQGCISNVRTNENKSACIIPSVNSGKNSKMSSEKDVIVTKAGTDVQPFCKGYTFSKDGDDWEVNYHHITFRGKTYMKDKPEDLDSFMQCKNFYSHLDSRSKAGSAKASLVHLEYLENCFGNIGDFEECSSFCRIIKNCDNVTNDLSSSDDSFDDDDFESEDYSKLWESLLTCKDPYNPLNFTACIRTYPSITKSDTLLKKKMDTEQLCIKKLKCEKKRKPTLPEWPFKHTCGSTDGNIAKVCVWKKTAKSTVNRAIMQHQHTTLKQVRFSPVVHVHTMCAWSYALRAARKGPWEEMARDRERFQSRINESEKILGHYLNKRYNKKILAKICTC